MGDVLYYERSTENPEATFRGLAALDREHSLVLKASQGSLPKGLQGVLYRNGPGRHEVFGERNHHWFDGDGMICRYEFLGDRMAFSNRYVQTPSYMRERAARRRIYPRPGTPGPRGIFGSLPGRMSNLANINVLAFDGRLLALSDMGEPIRLDPRTLETLGGESFGGTLRPGVLGRFPAHPKIDPRTGTLLNIAPAISPTGAVRWNLIEVKPGGGAQYTPAFFADEFFWPHDFGLSATRVIVFAPPQRMDVRRAMAAMFGRATFMGAMRWQDGECLTVHVADRTGRTNPRVYHLPAGFVVHVLNAFDTAEGIVVDAFRFEDETPTRVVEQFFEGRPVTGQQGYLTRFCFREDGSWRSEVLAEQSLEFVTLASDYLGSRYSYAYGLETVAGPGFSSRLFKIEVESGAAIAHDFGRGCFPSEPVFARRGSRAEDDGWVLSVVYDSTRHRSFVAILPADNFEHLAARVDLPFHVPLGFHGSFVRSSKESSS